MLSFCGRATSVCVGGEGEGQAGRRVVPLPKLCVRTAGDERMKYNLNTALK